MTAYKHTQIGYPILAVTLVVFFFFAWLYVTAMTEPPSSDSGTNVAVTAIMALILLVLATFSTLTISADEQYLRIKFGYGAFRKQFKLSDIASAKQVKNHWYYGWGIRIWFWPYMWIYNVSGFDAVEICTKDLKVYRLGTDEPETALALVLGYLALYGTAQNYVVMPDGTTRADEGAAAHIFQLLMGGQLPVIAYFALKYLPRAPKQALGILGLQLLAGLAACAPVFCFSM
jgi:hypothetical protein